MHFQKSTNLVLLLGGKLGLDADGELNSADEFLTQEVADLDQTAVILDAHVDGEMSVDRAHLVLKTVRDTLKMCSVGQIRRFQQNKIYLDHVLDVSAHGADRRQLLALAEPFADTELGGRQLKYLKILKNVIETKIKIKRTPSSSSDMCRKLRVSDPRGPLTVTTRFFVWKVTAN